MPELPFSILDIGTPPRTMFCGFKSNVVAEGMGEDVALRDGGGGGMAEEFANSCCV